MTLHELLGIVDRAGTGSVLEVNPDLITHIANGDAWKKEGYILFKGKRLIPLGASRSFLDTESIPASQFLHRDTSTIEGPR